MKNIITGIFKKLDGFTKRKEVMRKESVDLKIDQQRGTLTPHFHQWTDHPDRKSIRKHRP